MTAVTFMREDRDNLEKFSAMWPTLEQRLAALEAGKATAATESPAPGEVQDIESMDAPELRTRLSMALRQIHLTRQERDVLLEKLLTRTDEVDELREKVADLEREFMQGPEVAEIEKERDEAYARAEADNAEAIRARQERDEARANFEALTTSHAAQWRKWALNLLGMAGSEQSNEDLRAAIEERLAKAEPDAAKWRSAMADLLKLQNGNPLELPPGFEAPPVYTVSSDPALIQSLAEVP